MQALGARRANEEAAASMSPPRVRCRSVKRALREPKTVSSPRAAQQGAGSSL